MLVVALFTLVAFNAAATAKTKPVELRVLTNKNEVLAEQIQYAGPATLKASPQADCFGEDSPSSGKTYDVPGLNALTALAATPLKLSITDAFFDSFGSLGVCSIAGNTAPPGGSSYWYFAVDHTAALTGANTAEVAPGGSVLWYLTSGQEPNFTVTELELAAPARSKGKSKVTVFQYTAEGERVPAEGATVSGGAKKVVTGADGTAVVTIPEGGATLQATRKSDRAVPSNREFVCNLEVYAECPRTEGERIVGSGKRDVIRTTAGNDTVRARGGDDKVNLRPGGDDRVNCGGGRDVVVLAKGDKGDKLTSCEVKRRV
jgi:hypothetical protein